jgi:hypothetical protein
VSRRATEAQRVARFVAERAGVDPSGPRYADLVALAARTMVESAPRAPRSSSGRSSATPTCSTGLWSR